jgi:hypothetical protein
MDHPGGSIVVASFVPDPEGVIPLCGLLVRHNNLPLELFDIDTRADGRTRRSVAETVLESLPEGRAVRLAETPADAGDVKRPTAVKKPTATHNETYTGQRKFLSGPGQETRRDGLDLGP